MKYRVHLTIPQEIHTAARMYASRAGTSLSAVFNLALVNFLRDAGALENSHRGLPSDETSSMGDSDRNRQYGNSVVDD